jgi:hypothetical protein
VGRCEESRLHRRSAFDRALDRADEGRRLLCEYCDTIVHKRVAGRASGNQRDVVNTARDVSAMAGASIVVRHMGYYFSDLLRTKCNWVPKARRYTADRLNRIS